MVITVIKGVKEHINLLGAPIVTGKRKALTKIIAVIIVVIVIIAVVAGTYVLMKGKGGGKTTTTTQTESISYNNLTIGVVASKLVLDPAIADNYPSWFVLSKVMEGLVKINPRTGALEPGLAIKWVSPDNGKTWIFILRNNIKFDDGTPCKAGDVVRSLERAMYLRGKYSWMITSFIYNIEAVNDTAIKIILKKPIQDFPAFTSVPIFYVVSPQYPMENAIPTATFGGVGPYMIKYVRLAEVVLVANPNYYGKPPHVKKLTIRIYPSSNDLALALERGEIDIAWWGLSPTEAQTLSQKGFNIIQSSKTAVSLLALRTTVNSPLSNIDVRKAVAEAIDQTTVSKDFDGKFDEPTLSILPTSYVGYTPVFQKYAGLNVAKARQLLGRVGYNESHKLNLVLITSSAIFGSGVRDLANIVKRELEATGVIEVDVRNLTYDSFLRAISEGSYDMALVTIYPIYPEPSFYMILTMYSKANRFLGITYSNPQVDFSIERALSSVDYTLRQNIYQDIENTQLVKDIPVIPLLENPTFAAVKPGIQGVGILPNMMLSTP